MTQKPEVLKTVTRVVTYLGRRVRHTTEHHDVDRFGDRTVTIEYIDEAHPDNGGWPAGTVRRARLKGDGTREGVTVIEDWAVVGE